MFREMFQILGLQLECDPAKSVFNFIHFCVLQITVKVRVTIAIAT